MHVMERYQRHTDCTLHRTLVHGVLFREFCSIHLFNAVLISPWVAWVAMLNKLTCLVRKIHCLTNQNKLDNRRFLNKCDMVEELNSSSENGIKGKCFSLKKLATGHHRQTAPLPVKNDSSLALCR